MASEVEICNLALSHLGDSATVASIDPPEGSAQAEHCARFYSQARDTLLEMHSWGFASRRVKLAELEEVWPQWAFAYARPADCVTALAVLPYDAAGDYQNGMANLPQDFTCEIDSFGQQTILTNQPDAMLRYVSRMTDTTRYPMLFTMALSHMLASMLAGPLIKGTAGITISQSQSALATQYARLAVQQDVGQQSVGINHSVGWIAGR